MVSYAVESLFTCIPTQQVVKVVKKQLSSRTNFTPDHISALLVHCLMTTYFQKPHHAVVKKPAY